MILDRVFPPDQCDDRAGDRWVLGGASGIHIIGADPEYPFLRSRLILPHMDDEGEMA